ncbi:nudix hydrolase 16, mitochondrial-like [Macadamia integrifolia]|uniref:nudix hydrolase 16, mitochondrial-like n=1 Tax=Macadamia integrifolia TaxID=60698 RepID=UPI001C529D3A|nr:nudix hydrolase 16, mitochondrial-like [Macadamia integrifolia]
MQENSPSEFMLGVLQLDGDITIQDLKRCIPFRWRDPKDSGDAICQKIVEVLMINSASGPGLLFPKGGWEDDETVEEAAEREALEEAGVRGQLMVKNQYFCFIHSS